MATTFFGLQLRVKRRVIDLPQPVLDEIPTLINEAIFSLQQAHNFRVMEYNDIVYTQVSNKLILSSLGGASYNFPTHIFKEWRGEPYSLWADGSVRFISIAPTRRAIYPFYNDASTGFPRLLLENPSNDMADTHGMYVFPLPDGLSDYPDGEYRIFLPYYRYLGDLGSSGDSNWFADQRAGEQYIVAKATADAFALDWDNPNQAKWETMAENYKKQLIKADKMSRLGPVESFVPHWRGVNSSKVRL